MVYSSLQCAEMLAEKDINISVINARFAKPLDEKLIIDVVNGHQIVLTIEDHSLVGGFGSAIQELLVDKNINTQNVHRLGIPDKFVEHGSRNEILKALSLDTEGIYENFILYWNSLEPADIKSKEVYKQAPNLI